MRRALLCAWQVMDRVWFFGGAMDIALEQRTTSASPAPPSGTPSRSQFTLRHAIILGFVLGILYAGVAGIVAHQMAADGACLASQHR